MGRTHRSSRKVIFAAALLISTLFVSTVFISSAFGSHAVPSLNLSTKVNKRQVTASWKKSDRATSYSIWRSMGAQGQNAICVGVVTKKATTTFVDRSVAPGITYYYAVRAADENEPAADAKPKGVRDLVWSDPIKLTLTWNGAYSPHLGSKFTAKHESGCRTCHGVASADKNNTAMLTTKVQGSANLTSTQKCLDCHMESKAPGQQSVGALFAKKGSGHTVASAATPDAPLTCVTCHDPHADSSIDNALSPESITLGKMVKEVTNEQNGTCFACHDDAQSWYKQTLSKEDAKNPQKKYPKASKPARETGLVEGYFDYPTLGTYPGETTFKKSPHATIMPSGTLGEGDCGYCHSSHRSEAPYDGLLTSTRGEYRAMKALGDGTNVVNPTERTTASYAEFCLSCHGTDRNELSPSLESKESTTTNIRTLVTANESEVETSTAGHIVSSPNATVPEGAAIPCYECHNPHGSQTGNVAMISDERGAGITKADLDRNFCFSCHASYEGNIWDFGEKKWVAPTDEDKVVGLSRTGKDRTLLRPEGVANNLKLRSLAGDAHKESSNVACVTCHVDVHHPELQTLEEGKEMPQIVTGFAQGGALGGFEVVDNAYFGDEAKLAAVGVEYSISEDFTAFTPEYVKLSDLSQTRPSLDGGHYFNLQLSSLEPGTTYYYRAVRESSTGEIAGGEIKSFTTSVFAQ